MTRLVLIAATAYGAVKTADIAWAMGDLGVGLMAWLNIIAIWILYRPAMHALKDFERQKKEKGQAKPRFTVQILKRFQLLRSG